MGYLGRRIGKSQDTGNSFPDNGPDVGGGILDLFASGYFERQGKSYNCLLYTSPSPRDQRGSRMPSSA